MSFLGPPPKDPTLILMNPSISMTQISHKFLIILIIHHLLLLAPFFLAPSFPLKCSQLPPSQSAWSGIVP